MPVFDRGENGITRMAQRLGRVGIVRATFEAARETNPTATLLLNDFDMSADYERLIEDCLGAGIRIDALGLQSHMHQGYWGVEKTLDILERFSRFGLPIHFTESTLVSGHLMPPEIVDLNDYQVADWPTTPEGEARQADEVETHYRTLFGAPGGPGDHLVGLPGRGLAQRPDRARPRGRLAQAGVRAPPRAGQGRVVAGADDDAHRRRRADPADRVPRRLRGHVARPDGRVRPRRPGVGRGDGDATALRGAPTRCSSTSGSRSIRRSASDRRSRRPMPDSW